MRIGIDISQIVYGTGVSVYTRELVKNLLKIDKDNNYVLFGGSMRLQRNLREFSLSLKGNFETKIVSIPPTIADFIWNRIHRFKIERLVGRIDIFHSSNWSEPPTKALKVTTIHDLAPLKFPRLTPRKVVEVHKRKLYWSLRECSRIIVPTNAVKKDLLTIGGKEEMIRVIPEGVTDDFEKRSLEEIETLKKRYLINGKYLISIGVGERKNTRRLIDAFLKVKHKDLKLVLVGIPTSRFEEKRGVIFTGFVPQKDLPTLYSGAEALVYPSIYEGFGLPILQAFKCGIPAVVSNDPALVETGGNAVVLVDPESVNSIAEGIEKALARKISLVKLGEKRVKQFSWEKTAEATLNVYQEIKK